MEDTIMSNEVQKNNELMVKFDIDGNEEETVQYKNIQQEQMQK